MGERPWRGSYEGIPFPLRWQALRLARELRDSLTERDAALAKVRMLSGLLPICAGCKKIRDEQGRWQRLEAYISDHSQAQFSHGLCPDCAERFIQDIPPERSHGGAAP